MVTSSGVCDGERYTPAFVTVWVVGLEEEILNCFFWIVCNVGNDDMHLSIVVADGRCPDTPAVVIIHRGMPWDLLWARERVADMSKVHEVSGSVDRETREIEESGHDAEGCIVELGHKSTARIGVPSRQHWVGKRGILGLIIPPERLR